MGQHFFPEAVFAVFVATQPFFPQHFMADPVYNVVNPVGPQVPSMAPVLSPSGGGGGTTPPNTRPATHDPAAGHPFNTSQPALFNRDRRPSR